jgi:hypothetical protein
MKEKALGGGLAREPELMLSRTNVNLQLFLIPVREDI